MSMLQFVSTQVWRALFGKPADSLEKSIDNEGEFMIVDFEPLTSTFVSVPANFGQLSVDAYMSGIVAGVLCGAGFDAKVIAHSVQLEDGEHGSSTSSSSNSNVIPGNAATGYLMPPRKEKAVFLVKFSTEVLERDAAMDR
jgi:trafficking protein particle complex subunit 5